LIKLSDLSIHEVNDLAGTKGCTANVVLIKDQTLYVANAGDSRCVMAMGGKAIPLSVDHKPTLASERQRIHKAGSRVNSEGRIDGNLNLSRAIGDQRYKRNRHLGPKDQPVTAFPDVRSVQITSKVDFVVIGCDGIWETKSNQQIIDFIY
jgi:serine/threonine protein phosphatase PrpC